MRRRACRRVRAEGLQQAGIVRSDRRSRGGGENHRRGAATSGRGIDNRIWTRRRR
ncbi:valine--tRNA ligase, mitochondrial 1 isoform X3 [Iris pallida]|uniref:Valine--tRNA ligase, mitochondrial 1 isoform X3 n=1 Tax=Iris pallida TaxID=29817 RepID=A0AAX6FBS7_IRIPA|nr:valine--tRNA ligase, mitochondrial 1 isoform X3 [Iris pallida]